ncbi:unnamed protein product [Mycena citricolor]|uniref:Uncharacterized protein n=1 Tax=Mycena citricolor TaxID=2018698 RepID=A0AAD2HHQ7_9AGAR|nr:unnamed protein product [Mycena citricolor]
MCADMPGSLVCMLLVSAFDWTEALIIPKAQFAGSSVIVVTSDCILALRVWILYRRSRTLLYFFSFLMLGLFESLPVRFGLNFFSAETTVFIYTGYHTVEPLTEFIHLGPLLPGCYSPANHRILTYYALPELVLSIMMFAMTLYKCRASSLTLRDVGIGRTPIVAIFLRDGLFWFLAVLALAVTKLILWHGGRPTLVEAPIVPATALVSVIGARVLLNIKSLAAPLNHRSLYSTSSASAPADSAARVTFSGGPRSQIRTHGTWRDVAEDDGSHPWVVNKSWK